MLLFWYVFLLVTRRIQGQQTFMHLYGTYNTDSPGGQNVNYSTQSDRNIGKNIQSQAHHWINLPNNHPDNSPFKVWSLMLHHYHSHPCIHHIDSGEKIFIDVYHFSLWYFFFILSIVVYGITRSYLQIMYL